MADIVTVLDLLKKLGCSKLPEPSGDDEEDEDVTFVREFYEHYRFWEDLRVLVSIFESLVLGKNRAKVVIMKFCNSSPAERHSIFRFVVAEYNKSAAVVVAATETPTNGGLHAPTPHVVVSGPQDNEDAADAGGVGGGVRQGREP